MRLTCPNCGAQYEVARDAVPAEGRDVQCSNCSLTWLARPDPESMAEEAARPAPPRSTITPEIAEILRAEAEREAAARRRAGLTGPAPERDTAEEAPFEEVEDDPAESAPQPETSRSEDSARRYDSREIWRAEEGEEFDWDAIAGAPTGSPAAAPARSEADAVTSGREADETGDDAGEEVEDAPSGATLSSSEPDPEGGEPYVTDPASAAPHGADSFAAPSDVGTFEADDAEADDRGEANPFRPMPGVDADDEATEPSEEEAEAPLGETHDPAGADDRSIAFEPEDDDDGDDPFRDDLEESGPEDMALDPEGVEAVAEEDDPLEPEAGAFADRSHGRADDFDDLEAETDRDPFRAGAEDAETDEMPGETEFDDPEGADFQPDVDEGSTPGAAELDAGDAEAHAEPFEAESGLDTGERPFAETQEDDDFDADPFRPDPEQEHADPRAFAVEGEDEDFDDARDDDPFASGPRADEADQSGMASGRAERFERDDPLASGDELGEPQDDPFIYASGRDEAGAATEDARAKQRQDEAWADTDKDEDWTEPEEDWADMHAAARERAALAAASTGAVTRRDLLPDIEEINSSLRSAPMRGQPGGAVETTDNQRGRGFRLGFGVALLLAAGLALVYSHAGRIGAALPPLAPLLDSYATVIDGLRIELDSWLQSLIDALG